MKEWICKNILDGNVPCRKDRNSDKKCSHSVPHDRRGFCEPIGLCLGCVNINNMNFIKEDEMKI